MMTYRRHYKLNIDDPFLSLTPDQYRWMLEKAGFMQTDLARYLGVTKNCLQFWWQQDYMKQKQVNGLRSFVGDHLFTLLIKCYNINFDEGNIR